VKPADFIRMIVALARQHGICTRCFRQSAVKGGKRCKGCRHSVNATQRRRYERDLLEGTCTRCHKCPAMPTNNRCAKCEAYHYEHK
jgi:hypothetical protein